MGHYRVTRNLIREERWDRRSDRRVDSVPPSGLLLYVSLFIEIGFVFIVLP